LIGIEHAEQLLALPTTNGQRIDQYQPRLTRSAEITWPNQPPKTAIGAAINGSMPHTQIDIATIAKANPEMPCTSPAIAAPNASSHNSDVMQPISNTNRLAPRV
jgi:hypothetical protein